ncbi:MAG: UDP-3-O-(3-hydroxymyristoyl)glucosamine N-acyltransferase [Deltaproteobacteria bacterium]|nr:UDP-3-O-(3-hydroxymyristoyl)glucosamine N-acyltransferase [Deltaproteobacteria bacterium]MBW2063932.1 UDP-3-O-(3-hydroxymyristoyl)glucosamine N-acyltransferase [Deltaproteobacteria bacterium]
MYGPRDIEEVLHDVDHVMKGNKSALFNNAKPIHECDERSITFCKGNSRDEMEMIERAKAAVVICASGVSLRERTMKKKLLVMVEEPRLAFARILKAFFEKKTEREIHPSAIIEDSSMIDSDVYIGPFCYVGEEVEIGKGSCLYPNVTIYHNVKIGKNVILHSGVVIGSDGFGYSRNNEGVWEKFPHIGDVIIEDFVEIGPNSCVDRGTLGSTIIRKGVKIDNLVYVGHNAVIGNDTAISGNTTVGGCVVGKHCWIAPGCTIKEKITIGDNSFIGIGSVVIENVQAGTFVIGVPARKIGENPYGYRKRQELSEKPFG